MSLRGIEMKRRIFRIVPLDLFIFYVVLVATMIAFFKFTPNQDHSKLYDCLVGVVIIIVNLIIQKSIHQKENKNDKIDRKV